MVKIIKSLSLGDSLNLSKNNFVFHLVQKIVYEYILLKCYLRLIKIKKSLLVILKSRKI